MVNKNLSINLARDKHFNLKSCNIYVALFTRGIYVYNLQIVLFML